MSGIAGFVSLDGSPASGSDLTPMVEAIAYRGPDGVDVSVVGEAALAQLWLRTTPQSVGAKAPVTSAGGALIVGDVRLDEREDLARVLPFDPTTTDDLEIVALAFDRWGGGGFAHLRGDFAIAAWVPGERRLFLARDSFGVKPLFYARRGQRVFFGSQPVAILGHPDVAGAPDETRIACELMGVSPPAERTVLRGDLSRRAGTLRRVLAARGTHGAALGSSGRPPRVVASAGLRGRVPRAPARCGVRSSPAVRRARIRSHRGVGLHVRRRGFDEADRPGCVGAHVLDGHIRRL